MTTIITQGLDAKAIADEIIENRRIPYATYRVQFSPEFTFKDARNLVGYLHELGISDLYTSPLFMPRQGSTHGYDTVNYNRLNLVLGDDADFEYLVARLREANMGLILDVVPNHMGIGQDNVYWMDVLENGPGSRYAGYFDIDWRYYSREMDDKVLLPVLGNHYGRVLEAGELELVYEDGGFYVYYYENRFPIVTTSSYLIIQRCYDEMATNGHPSEETVMELESILTALHHLPAYNDPDPERLRERLREQTIIKRRFAVLYHTRTEVQTALKATLDLFGGVPGKPESYDLLDEVLNQQPYRLAFWRAATDEINYRRFFDINDMAAIRVELPEVFEDVHRMVFKLLAEGKISGLRIDHPDGLWNPPHYLRRLQETFIVGEAEKRASTENVRDAVLASLFMRLDRPEEMTGQYPVYVVAEKILSETEPLPTDWAVYGTTGYDFMNAVNGIFVNQANEEVFTKLYTEFVQKEMDFKALVYLNKKKVMTSALASEINARSQQLAKLVERNRLYRGFTLNRLNFALVEIIACMSIYRTYITGPDYVSERDQFYTEEAVAEAKRRNPRVPTNLFDFVRDTLLLRHLHEFKPELHDEILLFVMKFQQITGPVMAKSVEDTAFYIYNRLTSINEVGGHPEQFGISVQAFHDHNRHQVEHWRHTMLSLSTHDTKRSEDVRARINVLSELPYKWANAINLWTEMNEGGKTHVSGELAPDRNDEYLLYQILLGVYPFEAMNAEAKGGFVERIKGYMLKALNEGKVHSSWINPGEAYVQATQQFIDYLFQNETFWEAFDELRRLVCYFGQFNSLSQTLLKLTSPGVPDTYQGNELWDFSLVDPDNRRPVDYEHRLLMLADLKSRMLTDRLALLPDLLNNSTDGGIKLFVTYCALTYRRDYCDLFALGDYIALNVGGEKAEHVCAFLRQLDDQAVLVVVPRLVVGLMNGEERPPTGVEVWGDTYLELPTEAGQHYHDLFSGQDFTAEDVEGRPVLRLAKLLEHFPVALLERVHDNPIT